MSGQAYRLSVASRVLAASVGGYAVTSLMVVGLSLLLSSVGVNQSSAILGATIAGFLVWTAIAMAVFHARTAWRAWAWLAVVAAPFAIAVLVLPMRPVA